MPDGDWRGRCPSNDRQSLIVHPFSSEPSMTRSLILAALLAIVPAAAASAQAGDLSPTDGGGAWQVKCTVIGGSPVGPCNDVFADAVRVTASPAGWAAVPVAGVLGDAYYISPVASASVWADAPGEAPHYEYTFRTTFWQDDASSVGALSLSTFYLDNYWGGWSLNGSSFDLGGITPGPLPVNGNNWSTKFGLLVAPTSFQAGWNTLDLRISGNGRTDGILAQGAFDVASVPQETVPEPATMTLLATGLAGMAAARRRRKV